MKQRRNTKQRRMVLDAVLARRDHPGADQIYLDVRSIDGKISRGTVYRNLNFLVRQGEVLRIKLPHMDKYEGGSDKHYHLLCTECGAVCDAPLPYHSNLDKRVAEKTGYTVERHRAVFEGLCPACRQKKNQTSK
ncbi:MAG: transcriptional repressor [Eubacteriales bacterium]